ncbi:AAA family ATPase [Lysinibacillus sp. NPDC086135]|uniref:AAA family ATPase n=1 Tax=Lysinibacillus sp. NPDC086135 TaxID=3364130 RepID=UPI00380BF668
MRLDFIWFNKYKQLEDFQANFGSEYFYAFNIIDDMWIVEKSDSYIEGFFYSKQNVSVSAIVGENGVGKSTVLDFITDLFNKNLKNVNYFVAFDYKGTKIIVQNIYKDVEKINIINKEYLAGNYVIYFDNNYSGTFPNVIFFSNVFDVRYLKKISTIENFPKKFSDISTNFLLGSNGNNIVEFLNLEFNKQIYFIYDFIDELEIMGILKKPEYIKLKIIENEDYEYEDLLDDSTFNFDKKIFQWYFGFLSEQELKSITEVKREFIVKVLRQYIYVLDKELDVFRKSYNTYIPPIPEIYDGTVFEMLDDVLKMFYLEVEYEEDDIFSFLPVIIQAYIFEVTADEDVEECYALTKSIINKITDISNKAKRFIKKIIKLDILFLNGDLENSVENIDNMYIKTTSIIKPFINLYEEIYINNNILNFSWTQLSSGEYSILSLFGRIYDTYKKIKNKSSDLDSILLLIDEGDLYFHPQWQKDWLYYFLEFINKIFEEDVQIIITTHSPLVLSDFPNSNVLFMGGDENNGFQLEGSSRTLGANILELFANSFFLKNGLVGRFGKNKIK